MVYYIKKRDDEENQRQSQWQFNFTVVASAASVLSKEIKQYYSKQRTSIWQCWPYALITMDACEDEERAENEWVLGILWVVSFRNFSEYLSEDDKTSRTVLDIWKLSSGAKKTGRIWLIEQFYNSLISLIVMTSEGDKHYYNSNTCIQLVFLLHALLIRHLEFHGPVKW